MIRTRHDIKLTRVGGNYDEDATWVNYPDSWRSVWSGVINQPLPLRFLTFVEGTDIPFFTRQLGHGRVRQQVLDRRHRLVTQGFIAPVPFALAAAQPDELPLRVKRFTDVVDRWRFLTGLKWRLSREARFDRNFTLFTEAPATAYAVLLCDLLSEIQYHLLENVIDGGLTWSLWSTSEVVGSLIQRMNRLNELSGIIQARTSVDFLAGDREKPFPSDVMKIRRAVWREGSTRTVLTPIGTHALDNGFPGWQLVSGTPSFYIEEPMVRGKVQLYPRPSTNGAVEFVYLPRLSLQTTNQDGSSNICTPLPIPGVFAPYVKYGTMADMLMKEGEANEPERAQYCEQRFQEGVELARAMMGVEG